MARRYVIRQDAAPVAPISGIDYRTALNEEQYAAVSSEPGPALVIAGAGSGKTRTLTYRVAWLLDHGTDPWNILLLTFTNKAAREMTERVRSLIPLDLSRLWSGTFHSIANRILRQHAEYLGYTPTFTIMDSDDRKSMIKSVVKSLKLDEKSTRFPKPEVLSSLFSLADNEGANIRETQENAYPYLSNHLDAILEVHDQYVARKQETNSMDFDDLLLNVVRLFQEQEHLRALYGSRFQHILVDEYQDTNYLQSRLIDMLAREHGQLMVVGDDAQSIYSWRGADMENILSFTTRYPAAKTFKIETNYRSVPEILELSNAAIAANEVQIEKQLRSVRPTGEMPPALVPLNDDRMQAKFVVQRIRDLIEEGTDPSEIAVLYRAHFHSMELQMELTRGEIPFRITSGIRFFEQAHIKDVVAFMRFVVNPRDELSFRRMVMLLPGIGPGMAQKLWIRWTACPESRKETPPESFSALMLDFPVPAKSRTAWTQLCYTLDELAPAGKLAGPASMLLSINEAVYDEYMQAAFENYDQRRQDLLHLAGFSERFESTEDFLSQLSLLGNTDDESAAAGFSGGSVTLSTIHQAKGLEWSVVFLIGLCDGMFPHQRVIDDGDLAGLEEERRLFYVGITRAKDQLYLTYPRWNCRAQGGTFMQMPSRFLDEFPAGLVEEWEVE